MTTLKCSVFATLTLSFTLSFSMKKVRHQYFVVGPILAYHFVHAARTLLLLYHAYDRIFYYKNKQNYPLVRYIFSSCILSFTVY